jgi:hypothetical protein
VTNIGSYAFYACQSLTNVTIPVGVTSIGDDAFAICTSVASVTIPGSVTNIGDYAFYYCLSLTNAIIAGRVASIGDWTFSSCASLASVAIPGSVTNIGEDAFSYCAELANITIPAGMASIGNYAFYDCASLAGIYFTGNVPATGTNVFGPEIKGTVYYLPGGAGWSSPFAGLPVMLWNPLIQARGASFGAQTNHFGFNITGTTNIPILVEACANLANPVWSQVATNTLAGGSFFFSEPLQTKSPSRYYRISAP